MKYSAQDIRIFLTFERVDPFGRINYLPFFQHFPIIEGKVEPVAGDNNRLALNIDGHGTTVKRFICV
ncbi:hypothetical protein D3C72_1767600 [compost metagenome]